MTTIRGGNALGVEPGDLPVHLSRGAHPFGLAASDVTRRALHELPAAVALHPGRRPSRPVAPYREERCPAMPTHALSGITRS